MTNPQPYPKNVPGDFVVNDHECIACGAPEAEAPDLMDNDGTSCFFKKQPTTPEELDRAIRAVCISCVAAVRYVGHDPMVFKRMAEIEDEYRLRAEAHWTKQSIKFEKLRCRLEKLVERKQQAEQNKQHPDP